MKKTVMALAAVLLLSATPTFAASTGRTSAPVQTTAPVESVAQHQAQLARLDEINEMDKSGLSAAEKKDLRQEARAIKSIGGGVYISAGALILVVVLLIILL